MTIIEYLQQTPLVFTSGVIILGCIVGSFLNVVIHRLPIMMEREWKRECRIILELDSDDSEQQPTTFNLAQPNSHCPQCNAEIKPWQNIPIISYLLLKGRCANCGCHISVRYQIIEVVSGIMCGVVAWHFGAGMTTLALLFFTWALISLTMIDADTQLLPDQITLPLLWLGILVNTSGLIVPLSDAVWGAIGGYMVLWSVYWLFKLLTGKEGMGFGDFKLLAALGAWMGWQMLPLIILLSSLVGAVVGIAILAFKRQGRDTAIPFGPYLAAAGWIALIWGEPIIDSYLQIAGMK